MLIKQSLCIPCFKPADMALADFCHSVAAIGFQAVEIWFRDAQFEALMDAVREADLRLASMAGHTSLTDGLNNEANHDRIEAELIESIDLAKRYHIPGLICFSGNRMDGESDETGLANCTRILKRVAPHAERCRVNLNIELLNSKINHPGYQCDHTDWGVALCKAVDSQNVKLLYDIYHMQIMEGDIIRTLKESIDYIGHFHTAGNPGRHEPDITQELNYRAICQAISATGYTLYVGHEFNPRHNDWHSALQQAFDICNVP